MNMKLTVIAAALFLTLSAILGVAYAQSTIAQYDRDDWRHWCNERHHMLLELSAVETTLSTARSKPCTVINGSWYDPFTNKTYTRASDVDIDHVVPLSHAHSNGGANWSDHRKTKYANDRVNLAIMDDGTNSSKGDKAPNAWMPPAGQCEYLNRWATVKNRYALWVSAAEYTAVSELRTTHSCSAGGTVPMPTAVPANWYTDQTVQTTPVPPPSRALPVYPPELPTGLTATVGDGQVTLSWDAASGANSYEVNYRNLTDNGAHTDPVTVRDTRYTFTGLTNGKTYALRVIAVNAGGRTKASVVQQTPRGGPLPAKPDGLSATASANELTVSWTAVPGATGYRIRHRVLAPSETFSAYTDVSGASHTLSGLERGTRYGIRVLAVNANGSSREAILDVRTTEGR